MGFWDKLTKTAVQDPITGEVRFYDSPGQLGAAEAKAQAQLAQPATATVDNQIPEPGQPVDPGFTQPTAAIPRVFKPTYQQASEDASGMPAKNTPGLTRLGKLMQVLVAAGKGAMAGQAASAQAVAASGGHRGGSFGMGFEAAERQPYEEAARERANTQGAIQTQMAQAQMQPIQTPAGTMPFWMATRLAQMRKEQYLGTRNGVFDVLRGQTVPGTQAPPKERLDVPGVDVPFSPEVEAQKARIEQAKADAKPDKVPQRDDRAIAIMQADIKAKNPSLTDDQAYKMAYDEWVKQTKVQPSLIRAEGFAETRGMPVTDTQTGITAPMSWADYNRLSKAEPGRWTSPQYDAEIKASLSSATAVGRDMPTQVRSFGQFLGHAADLSNSVNELGNLSGKKQLINRPYNWLRKNALGDTAIINFLAKVDPVRKEFESFLINNRALTVDDRARGQEILGEDKTPAQMQEAIRSFMHTALVRLGELNQAYYTQTGHDYPGLLSPKAAKILEDFGFGNETKVYRQRGAIGGTTAKRGGTPAAPPEQSVYPGVRFTPIQ